MTSYGFLGPVGTFTQAALSSWLQQQPDASDTLAHATAYQTVPAALDAVRSGEVDVVVVPIENSVEGGVSATLDALNAAQPLRIVGEVLVPITFVLAALPGTSRADITGVGSHSHAWPQVRGWMATNMPAATYVPTLSTAAAAQGLVEQTATNYQAAVCAQVAADAYGLEVLAENIGDHAGAVTRFVAVRRGNLTDGGSSTPPPTGHDKTTLVLYQHTNRAGGLLELLDQFASRGVDMTRLESRPTGAAMGSYCFSIDIEGHIADARVAEALMGLKRVAADVRFLGSYARADREAVVVQPHMSDDAFRASREWLDSLT